MNKRLEQRSQKRGQPAGTLKHIGERKMEKSKIKIIDYSSQSYIEQDISADGICLLDNNDSNVRWINIEGIHEVNDLEQLSKAFGLHPMVMEDILNTQQRPKIEDCGKYVYLVLKLISFHPRRKELDTEQLSIVFGEKFVISFCESETKIFESVRGWIKNGVGKIKGEGSDFLAFTLLDIIVDDYFEVLDELSEKIEAVEEEVIEKPTPETLKTIHYLKRQLLNIHKVVWPLREIVGTLERSGSNLIKVETNMYIRDLYDHMVQVMEEVETFRDILSSLLDIYLSSVSNKMNDIMKILTIISTVFIPLSFIVGVYGMNFKSMPEYDFTFAYPILWVIMISISIFMLAFFKRKKWW